MRNYELQTEVTLDYMILLENGTRILRIYQDFQDAVSNSFKESLLSLPILIIRIPSLHYA
jgi:hypothetical protein